VCVLPEGPQTIPFVAAPIPAPAGGLPQGPGKVI
jgi:hypothetical protein